MQHDLKDMVPVCPCYAMPPPKATSIDATSKHFQCCVARCDLKNMLSSATPVSQGLRRGGSGGSARLSVRWQCAMTPRQKLVEKKKQAGSHISLLIDTSKSYKSYSIVISLAFDTEKYKQASISDKTFCNSKLTISACVDGVDADV